MLRRTDTKKMYITVKYHNLYKNHSNSKRENQLLQDWKGENIDRAIRTINETQNMSYNHQVVEETEEDIYKFATAQSKITVSFQ